MLKENNPAYKVDEDDASIDEVTPNAGMVEEGEEKEALRTVFLLIRIICSHLLPLWNAFGPSLTLSYRSAERG